MGERDMMRKAIAMMALAVGLAVLGPVSGVAMAQDVAAKAPPAPDYAARANWSVFASQGWASPLPEGAAKPAKASKAAVFFLHPTTLRSASGELNQNTADAQANKWTDESSIARQASVFAACCDVYAPRYRAASYNSFANGPVREAAFALAYSDVERAFDAFLQTIGNRPFIIAGHSQGAFHTAMLLEKRVDGTALQQRMVAAYIIGINLAQGDFGKRFKSVKPCATPDQTGCVVQWNAYLDGVADVGKFAAYSQSTYVQSYGDDAGKVTLCVNPLTFDARLKEAPSAAAKGAVPGSPGFGALQPLKPGAVSARCDSGLLLVRPDAALGLEPLPGGVMHYHDLGLFWADTSANASLRVHAFGGKGK